MQIERVEYSPRKEVYNPGEVLNVSLYLRHRFVGQCEAGLAPRSEGTPPNFRATTFAPSKRSLFEGQVNVLEEHIGTCELYVRLKPVKGKAVTFAAGDRFFYVRPLRP